MQPNAPGTQGYNLYAYAGNNPTTLIDPSGHDGVAGYAIRLQTVAVRSAPALLTLGLLLVATFGIFAALFADTLVCAVGLPPCSPSAADNPGATAAPYAGEALTSAARAIARYATAAISGTVAAAVARSCAQANLSQLASAKGLGDPCQGATPLFVTGYDVREASQHDLDVIGVDPGLALLHRQIPPHDRAWLFTPAALPNCPTPREPADQQCDEYPFASAVEGGETNRPDLKMILARDNTLQGVRLNSRVFAACHVEASQAFFVLPIPVGIVPSFGVCQR